MVLKLMLMYMITMVMEAFGIFFFKFLICIGCSLLYCFPPLAYSVTSSVPSSSAVDWT